MTCMSLSPLRDNKNDNAATFNITRYGNFTANFEQIPPPIRQEYLIGLKNI